MTNKKDITIITLWSDEKINVDMDIESFIEMQREDKALGEKEFLISKLKRTICYADIKGKLGKTQYLSIEAPKNEPTQEQRQKASLIIKELAKKAEINKEERFIKKRADILENLRLEEKRLGLMPTVEKIECYNKYKLTK